MAKLTQLSRSVRGKVVLVTGAGSGIGCATVKLFANEGAHVAVTDLVANSVEPVVNAITGAGGDARGWSLDVGNGDEVRRVISAAAAHFGGLDVLVNNAGISRPTPIDGDQYEDHWNETLNVLLTAQMRTVRAALPYLRESKAGRIINIASTEGLGATRFSSPYTTAKTGVIGLTRSLAVELGDQGITVNCVCPGPINTGMTESIPNSDKAKFARRRVPLKRYADPEEVAHGILNLALPASSYITGVALPIDGGLTIKNT